MQRQTATTAQPLSLAARKASVASIAQTATGKAKAGIALIDFREPTAREKALAETLVPAAKRALSRHAKAA
jgi:hypothetical protein